MGATFGGSGGSLTFAVGGRGRRRKTRLIVWRGLMVGADFVRASRHAAGCLFAGDLLGRGRQLGTP